MIRPPNSLSIHRRLVEKLEMGVTIFWLLYFMGVKFPPPIPASLVNALSYPFITVLVALHWRRLSWVATRDILLLILLAFSLASFLWSDVPKLTLDANRGLLRMIVFGAYLAARYSIKEQMKIFTWVFAIGAILSLAVALAIPSYGISGRVAHGGAVVGLFPYKNYMGYSMVLGAITFLLVASFKKGMQNWLVRGGFCLAIILVILSRSSASLMCLFVLLSLMPLYQLIKLHYKPKIVILCFVCILTGSAAIIILGNLETILVNILGENVGFSGRTPIWTLVIEKVVEERPWLGYGMNAFWKSDAGLYVINNTWGSLTTENIVQQSFNFHNGYLPVFASLGFIGFFVCIASFLSVFTRVIILLFLTQRIEFFWLFQFLIFILIGGYADDIVSILNSSSYCVIYVSICLSTAVEYRKLGSARANQINTYKYYG